MNVVASFDSGILIQGRWSRHAKRFSPARDSGASRPGGNRLMPESASFTHLRKYSVLAPSRPPPSCCSDSQTGKDGPVFVLIWIHLLAAVAWVGGMAFLSVVLVPVLRRDGMFAQYGMLFRTVAYRFRAVVWGAMGILVGTGLVLAVRRSISVTEPQQWPTIFAVKMGFVVLLFSLTLLHDLVVGSQMRRVLGTAETERTARDRMFVRFSKVVPRVSLLVALLVLLLAVVLART